MGDIGMLKGVLLALLLCCKRLVVRGVGDHGSSVGLWDGVGCVFHCSEITILNNVTDSQNAATNTCKPCKVVPI